MAIQTINLTVPGGDTPRSANTKINANFTNTTHAASRLVGTATGNVMQVGAFGLGLPSTNTESLTTSDDVHTLKNGFYTNTSINGAPSNTPTVSGRYAILKAGGIHAGFVLAFKDGEDGILNLKTQGLNSTWGTWSVLYSTKNTTKDANGFIKAASPIVRVFADKVELNDDAASQDITFVKNGIGDYTIHTVSGLSTDGWYIELPKDINGNPKVAVTLDETDGVITLKSYKRVFSMTTFTFEPDLNEPLDVPDGRWIDLRLNDLPDENSEV